MFNKTISRRRFVATGAAAAAGVVAAPYVSSAQSAGTLKVGFWDHWVPGANKAIEDAVKAWGEKEKVKVEIDFITSQGNKILLTIAAEAQAKSGHDLLSFPTWQPARHVDSLEPVGDIMADGRPCPAPKQTMWKP